MLLELFDKGGWAMWPLLALLVFGIGVAIERFYNLSKAARVSSSTLSAPW